MDIFEICGEPVHIARCNVIIVGDYKVSAGVMSFQSNRYKPYKEFH